ncbi:MAG: 50S ribosomal protein L3 [Patescibacteria group bacterium]
MQSKVGGSLLAATNYQLLEPEAHPPVAETTNLFNLCHMTGILGRKIGMTRVIADDGGVIPVSVVECSPNEIVQVKTTEKDGYPALILGFAALKKPKKTKKFYHLAEFQLENEAGQKKGEKVTVAAFKELKDVRITGWSKGKGFAGVIKRYNFSRGPETHGSHHHRQPGSSGGPMGGTGRVSKGKRYPGRMGTNRVTRKTTLMSVDTEKNLIIVKGPIPGAVNGLIRISTT